MKGLYSEHWYGETGDRTGSKMPSQTSVDPAVQAYMVGRVQLSNLQKLAERQSCYSGPKKNLVEDERRTQERPTKKSERKLHWIKLWERKEDLPGSTTKN